MRPMTEAEFRHAMACEFRAPVDPDDETADLDHVDRAVFVTFGAVAAQACLSGIDALTAETPARWAAAELVTYLRDLTTDAYRNGREDGYGEGYTAGEQEAASTVPCECEACQPPAELGGPR